MCIFVATNITFDKSTYNIDEYDRAIHPVLILSNPISEDVTVKILSTNGSDDGKQIRIYVVTYILPTMCYVYTLIIYIMRT